MDWLEGFTTRSGHPYDVTAEGSLGLLALGDVGLMAWRQKRREASNVAEKGRPHRGENDLTRKEGDDGA